MNEYPDFLPPILNLIGNWDHILETLYEVFARDFKTHTTNHCGIRVMYNGKIESDGFGKEEGFWHVISKRDARTQERLIDFRRAERLPWARPLMESPERIEIKVFDYDHGAKKKGVRRYIWLENFDYVLILQMKRKVYYWVTAYYIDSKRRRRDLKRRYENRT